MQNRSRVSGCWAYALCLLISLLQTPASATVDASTNRDPQPAEVQKQDNASRWFDNLDLQNTAEISRFYSAYKFQPVWFGNQSLQDKIDDLHAFFTQARLEGMVSTALQRDTLERYKKSAQPIHEKARQDILLTDLFMSLVHFAVQGQTNPQTLDEEWHYERPEVDAVEVLQQVLDTKDITGSLSALLPQHESYRQLVNALAAYRRLAQSGGWPVFSLTGPSIEYGQSGAEIIQLRKRLRLSGDLASDVPDEPAFDYELEQAVKIFQRRHGLIADGVVGLKTREALHVSVEERIEQMTLNLERWRWLPRDLGERHIRINMAGFELQVYDNGKVPLSMRVIVGKDERKTPSFTRDINYLVFNPYWNVPNKLAREDLVPHILNDPDYFSRKKIRVFTSWGKDGQELDPASINWAAYQDAKYLPFKFRQDPGKRNSLGRIKFMLPNPFSVYLHDTPSRRLFKNPVRAFSSGCVRLEKPIALASYLMGDKWRETDIKKIIKTNKNKILSLEDPVPVHMLYQTAWVDQAGAVQFREDVYDRDKLLTAALPKVNNLAVNVDDGKNLTEQEPLSFLQN